MNDLYEIHNVVRFIEYFTFNTFFWRVGMKFQTKLIATCILLASSSYSLAENADGGRDEAALATTNDYVNSGSIIRKDDDKISIFNDLLTVMVACAYVRIPKTSMPTTAASILRLKIPMPTSMRSFGYAQNCIKIGNWWRKLSRISIWKLVNSTVIMMCRSINCMPKALCTTTLKRVSVNLVRSLHTAAYGMPK